MSESSFLVSLLTSGSSGNATYIETPQRKILVDCGLTGKAITAQMEKIGRSVADIDTILVTHEHVDHIKGIGVLARVLLYLMMQLVLNFTPFKKIKSNL